MVVVADLVARVSSIGVQEAVAQVKAVGAEAATSARALEIMAQKMAEANKGQMNAGEALDMLKRSGAQPTAAALAEAAKSMEKTSAAATQAVAPTQAAAKAAADHATSAATGARAVQEVSKGWTASESSIIRFSSALIGVNLGISLIAGAGRLLHAAILDTAGAQLVWEQSLMRTTALYGNLASSVIAVSQAQAQAPGLAGSQQEFLTANLNARYLGSRFGVPQASLYGLTSAAGRYSRVFGDTLAERQDIQARALSFAESGGSVLRNITGTEGDPLSIARRIRGGTSEGQLAALTPQQMYALRTEIAAADLNQTALGGSANTRGLVQAQAEKEKALAQAQGALQNSLEGIGGAFGPAQVPARRLLPSPSLLPAGTTPLGAEFGVNRLEPPSVLTNAVREAQKAFEDAAKAVVDTTTALAENKASLEKLGVSYDTATFRLLGFAGSLEDPRSIARGDIASGAQQAVADRMRSAIPAFGTPSAEMAALATNDAWQQAKQNLIARQAQQNQDNGIREWLAGQGPEGARAITEAERAQPVQQRIREAGTRAAQVDIQAADTQARLEAISLTQRERYVQLMRETVDLRRLDVQQQQVSLAATMNVVRAQQAALPAAQAMSAANYQSNLANALSLQRMSRLIQERDVSGLPSFDELIQMNRQGQFAAAEAAPASVTGARRVEVASQTATAAGLAQALTAGQLQSAQLGLDLQNLGDLPAQTALMLQDIENGRSQLSVQTELREYMKQLVYIMTNQPPVSVPADRGDRFEAGLRADLRSSGGPR